MGMWVIAFGPGHGEIRQLVEDHVVEQNGSPHGRGERKGPVTRYTLHTLLVIYISNLALPSSFPCLPIMPSIDEVICPHGPVTSY
jgi:hypothetical protein